MFRSNPKPIGAFTMVSAPLFFTGAFSSKTENKNKNLKCFLEVFNH
jgi:hypothetical protein